MNSQNLHSSQEIAKAFLRCQQHCGSLPGLSSFVLLIKLPVLERMVVGRGGMNTWKTFLED